MVVTALLLAAPVLAQPQAEPVSGPPSGETSEQAGGWVRILSMEPAEQQLLHPGQRVQIRVLVAYRQPGSSATLALSLQETRPEARPLAAVVKEVQAAEGLVTLQLEFQVPPVRELTVYVPLYLSPDQPTRDVDSRRLRVAEVR